MNALWFATRRLFKRWAVNRLPKVKLPFIGGIIGLVIGVALTVFYFSLATFFEVQAKALGAAQKRSGNDKVTIDRKNGKDRRKAR